MLGSTIDLRNPSRQNITILSTINEEKTCWNIINMYQVLNPAHENIGKLRPPICKTMYNKVSHCRDRTSKDKNNAIFKVCLNEWWKITLFEFTIGHNREFTSSKVLPAENSKLKTLFYLIVGLLKTSSLLMTKKLLIGIIIGSTLQ